MKYLGLDAAGQTDLHVWMLMQNNHRMFREKCLPILYASLATLKEIAQKAIRSPDEVLYVFLLPGSPSYLLPLKAILSVLHGSVCGWLPFYYMTVPINKQFIKQGKTVFMFNVGQIEAN